MRAERNTRTTEDGKSRQRLRHRVKTIHKDTEKITAESQRQEEKR